MARKDIKPKVRIPKSLKKGQVFEVKCVVTHPMESGQRPNKETGKKFPREIINALKVTYNGKVVLDADWHPAVSANPYTSFFVVAEESGDMVFTWTDDRGEKYTRTIKVKVAG
jgi:sulfur-oxidizing protein SoxZ